MNNLSIQVPSSFAAVFSIGEDDPGRSILTAAVVKWFELGKVSQGKAAEILGISRASFLDVLADFQVSAWQYSESELNEELGID